MPTFRSTLILLALSLLFLSLVLLPWIPLRTLELGRAHALDKETCLHALFL